MRNTLCKSERLDSKLVIDKLFAGGNSSFAVFPLRAVYMKVERTAADTNTGEIPKASILISVPKKRFHHAVDRNRLKRLVREAYRKNKQILWDRIGDEDYTLALAFICVTDSMPDYNRIEKSVRKVLTRISESL